MTLQSHLTRDQLVDLAHGLLPSGAADAAIAHAKACADCEEALQQVTTQREALRATRAPAELRNVEAGPRSPSPVGSLAVVAVVAAVVLLLVWPLPTGHVDDFYWLPVHGDPASTMRMPASGSPSYDRALDAYAHREVQTAHDLLESVDVPEPLVPERDLYLASTQQLLGRYEAALSTLEALDVATLPQPARRRALWIQYLCLRDSGQTGRAAATLEPLTREAGDIGQRARVERERISGPNR